MNKTNLRSLKQLLIFKYFSSRQKIMPSREYFSPYFLKNYLDEVNNNNLTVKTFKSCTLVQFPELEKTGHCD